MRRRGRRLRVAVLMGGQSDEHDVSVASGLQVLAALDRRLYEPIPVHVGRDGRWLLGTTPDSPSLAASEDGSAPLAPVEDRPAVLLATGPGPPAELRGESAPDVVFIALHGANGEDGVMFMSRFWKVNGDVRVAMEREWTEAAENVAGPKN